MLEEFVSGCFDQSMGILPKITVTIEGVPFVGVWDGRNAASMADTLGLVDSGSAVVTFQRSVMPEDPEEGDEAIIGGESYVVSSVAGKGTVAVTVYFRFENSDS